MQTVTASLIEAIKKASGQKDIRLEAPQLNEHGDYSSNIALTAGLNAQEIADQLSKNSTLKQFVSKIEVVKPGFINFFLSQEYLLQAANEVLEQKNKYGSSKLGENKTVLVEYSSPNIAKRFAIGHLRSTIIGQALYNLYKFSGYKVVSENHLGDWGTQFGTLLYQITNQNIKPDKLDLDKLEELYVDFNQKAQGDLKLWDEAKAWFKKLEEGDDQARKIWAEVRESSLKEFEKIYRLLGVHFDNMHGESFYEDKIPEIIQMAKTKKLAKESQGALIVELKNMPPGILVKSDGTSPYFTRDLAAIAFRVKSWKPDEIIYEVGSDQILHFRQVFAAAKLLGITKDTKLTHVAHGLIRFEDGKMSTRKGKTVKLEEVLEKAIEKAGKFNSKVAEDVGLGAVKYFDLMHSPTSDIVFDWEKIFVLEGNSGPYLQYTLARIWSVLAKLKTQNSKFKVAAENLKLNEEEFSLLRSFAQFQGVISSAVKNYSPNLLCNYLFDLAQKYNAFYAKHQILNTQYQDSRLALTAATGQILINGLTILGIQAPSEM